MTHRFTLGSLGLMRSCACIEPLSSLLLQAGQLPPARPAGITVFLGRPDCSNR